MKVISLKNQKVLLNRDFLVFSGVTISVVVILFILTTISSYYSESIKLKQSLNTKADAIDRVLTQTMSYIESTLGFVGASIVSTDLSKQQIAKILSNQGNNMKIQELLSWTVYDWVGPGNRILVNSTHGVLPKPVLSNREHLKHTFQAPGKLFISDANVGLVSKQLVIPAGLGVLDKRGRFIGTVNVGILVSELINQMQVALGSDNFSFVVINRDTLKFVAQSSGGMNLTENEIEAFNSKLSMLKGVEDAKLLPSPIILGGVDYLYYRNASQYPFILLMGVNNQFVYANFFDTVFPRILETVVIGLFFLCVLYYFRKRLVNPIIELASAATLVSQGVTETRIPRPKIWELHIMARQLLKFQYLIKRMRKAHAALAVSKDEALIAKDEAIAANNEIKRYISIITHDICSPLSSVIGFSEMMKKEMLGKHSIPEYKEYAENIFMATNHVIEMAHDLLYTGKLENGKKTLKNEPVDIAKVLDEVIIMQQNDAERKKIEIIKGYCSEGDLSILSERKIMLRICVNLLSNAIKYSDTNKSVTISTSLDDKYLSLIFKDEGYGISDVDEAVKPYNTVVSKNRDDVSSTGLGLYSVKQMVEKLHEGELYIESEVGKGTTVYCRFPISRLPHEFSVDLHAQPAIV